MTGWCSPSTWAAAGPRSGYVTVTGEPVWWWYERSDAVGGAEVQDADVVADHRGGGPAGARRGRDRRRRRRRRRRDRPVGQHGAGRRERALRSASA